MTKLCLQLLLLLPCFSFSFSLNINDTVRSISGVEIIDTRLIKKNEAGQRILRLDSTLISQKLNLSLSELLSESSTIFLKNHGRGALSTASFRGTAPSHTQVTWNGVNLNSPMLGMVDFSLIPVAIIDNISILHGAASISEGSGGIGGTVTINNKPEWNNKINIKYIQNIGSYLTFDELIHIKVGSEAFQIVSRLYHNYSKNNYTFINKSIGNIDPLTGKIIYPLDTNKNASFMKYGILQEVYYKVNKNNIISLRYWGQINNRSIPRPITYEGAINANYNKQSNDDHKIVAEWKSNIAGNSLLVRSGFSHSDMLYSVKNFISGAGFLYSVYSKSYTNSFLNTISYQINVFKNINLELKANANHHAVSIKDSITKVGYKKNRDEFQLFVSVSKSFFKTLNVNLMLRQEFTDNNWSPFVPYLGIDYKLFKNRWLYLKGSIARNFHKPTLNDLFWVPGGNPNLIAEKGLTIDLGAMFHYELEFINFNTELTVFRSDISDWIIWIYTFKGHWQPFNIKRVLAKGVELNANLKGNLNKIKYLIAYNLTYNRSINYGDPKVWGDNSYGKQLIYVPKFLNNLSINLNYKNFIFAYQFTHYSERHTTSSNDLTRRDWLYPYYMNDVTIGKSFFVKKISFDVEFKINNLLNEEYRTILSQMMPRRNYNIRLMIKI